MGVILFVLGANVSRHRAIRAGDGDQAPTDPADRLFIAQRAHGNAAEYVPTLAALIIVCAFLTDGWWLNALALAALAARVVHAYATLTAETLNAFIPVRSVGRDTSPMSPGSPSASPRWWRCDRLDATAGQVSCWLAMFRPLTYRQTGTATVAPAKVTAS